MSVDSRRVHPVKPRSIKPRRYLEILRSGCQRRGDLFIVAALQNTDRRTRLGLAVGKKIAATAVSRNYFKRQIRVAYRSQAGCLRNLDVIVRQRAAYSKSFAGEAGKELTHHFSAIAQCRDS